MNTFWIRINKAKTKPHRAFALKLLDYSNSAFLGPRTMIIKRVQAKKLNIMSIPNSFIFIN